MKTEQRSYTFSVLTIYKCIYIACYKVTFFKCSKIQSELPTLLNIASLRPAPFDVLQFKSFFSLHLENKTMVV